MARTNAGEPIKPGYWLYTKEYLQEAKELLVELGLTNSTTEIIAAANLLAKVNGDTK